MGFESMQEQEGGRNLTPREQVLIQAAVERGMQQDEALSIVESSMVQAREKGMFGEDQEKACTDAVAAKLGEDANKLWSHVVEEQEGQKRQIH